MVTGITHTAFAVTDINRSIDFYTKTLGLTEKFRMMNDSGEVILVYLKIDKTQFIELFPGAKGPYSRQESAGLVHVCLQVDDIHKTYQEFADRGLKADMEPLLAGDNTWQFWARDPDGIPIEFQQITSESRQITG